jgi:hypothetical protein
LPALARVAAAAHCDVWQADVFAAAQALGRQLDVR